jgi:hypothetical protein
MVLLEREDWLWIRGVEKKFTIREDIAEFI